jgi:carbon monoxide dehydrogenase subunit G
LIKVSRDRQIDAPPEAVFAALADPEQLSAIMPRVRRVEVLERGIDRARVATHMAIGPFGDIRSEGDVRWQTGREVVFITHKPVAVEARWALAPSGGGTRLQATLSLDLASLLGPLATFVPQNEVANMVAPDLEAALAAIAKRVERGR